MEPRAAREHTDRPIRTQVEALSRRLSTKRVDNSVEPLCTGIPGASIAALGAYSGQKNVTIHIWLCIKHLYVLARYFWKLSRDRIDSAQSRRRCV
jgi:hypothetical protein